jgi:hypothetical protein
MSVDVNGFERLAGYGISGLFAQLQSNYPLDSAQREQVQGA